MQQRPRIRPGIWFKWLGCWALLALVFCSFARPKPILELPVEKKSGEQIGIGFAEDSASFLTVEVVGARWDFGKQTAWNLANAQSTEVIVQRVADDQETSSENA